MLKTILDEVLIWVITSGSAQHECNFKKFAEFMKAKNPALHDFLVNGRCLDDFETIHTYMKFLEKLSKDVDKPLAQVNFERNCYTSYSSDPLEYVAEGQTMSIGGLISYSKLDLVEVPTLLLHFIINLLGRLTAEIQTFQGSFRSNLVKLAPPDSTTYSTLGI